MKSYREFVKDFLDGLKGKMTACGTGMLPYSPEFCYNAGASEKEKEMLQCIQWLIQYEHSIAMDFESARTAYDYWKNNFDKEDK